MTHRTTVTVYYRDDRNPASTGVYVTRACAPGPGNTNVFAYLVRDGLNDQRWYRPTLESALELVGELLDATVGQDAHSEDVSIPTGAEPLVEAVRTAARHRRVLALVHGPTYEHKALTEASDAWVAAQRAAGDREREILADLGLTALAVDQDPLGQLTD